MSVTTRAQRTARTASLAKLAEARTTIHELVERETDSGLDSEAEFRAKLEVLITTLDAAVQTIQRIRDGCWATRNTQHHDEIGYCEDLGRAVQEMCRTVSRALDGICSALDDIDHDRMPAREVFQVKWAGHVYDKTWAKLKGHPNEETRRNGEDGQFLWDADELLMGYANAQYYIAQYVSEHCRLFWQGLDSEEENTAGQEDIRLSPLT